MVGSAALVSLEVELDLAVESLSSKDVSFLLLFSNDELLGGVGEGSQDAGRDCVGFVKFGFLLFESELFSLESHLELGIKSLLSDVSLDVDELLVKSELKSSYLGSLFSNSKSSVSNNGSCISSVLILKGFLTKFNGLSQSSLKLIVLVFSSFFFNLILIIVVVVVVMVVRVVKSLGSFESLFFFSGI